MNNRDRRILVVDDDWTIWSSYEGTLVPGGEDKDSSLAQLKAVLGPSVEETPAESNYQFNLSFAPQGKEALEMVKAEKAKGNFFCLAFIDIRMPPGWDGMETARQIRRIDQDIEIVIVSAYSDRSITEITETVGFSHKLLFFRKPFDPDELRQLAISLTDKYYISLSEEQQRRKLEVLLNTSSAGVFTIDADNNVLTWNRAAEEITGYLADEVIGKSLVLDQITTDSEDTLDVEGEGNGLVRQQRTIIDKEKNIKILSLNFAAIGDTNGEWPETIGSFWDITIHKETERALRGVNRELKKQMKERDQLLEKQLRLERRLNQAQKMEAIGLMAGGVAHDLNNILSGIIGYPEILLLELPEDSKYRNAIKVMQDSGKRAAAVVADLLTVARGVAVEKQVASLNDLILEHLRSAEGKLLQENYPEMVIKTVLTTEKTAIYCSPVHIRKCLMNLLHNAAEALTEFSGVVITTGSKKVTSEEQADNAMALEPGDYVTLTVADQGPGISSDDIKHIFEPFFTKKKIGRSGTGLGLAVVYNTVQDHNGAITVESDGEGTVFKMLFPLSSESPASEKQPKELEDLQGVGSVLVVDDERQQREIAKRMLEALGYNVATASSGEDAVDFLKSSSVDLVLLDMIMHPGMNGLKTYEAIIKQHPGQKAIITSGYSESCEVLQAKNLGVGAFIGKPFSLEQLGHAVKCVMTSSAD